MSNWYMLDEDKNVIPAPVDGKGIPTNEYHIWLYGSGLNDPGNRPVKQETVNGHWVSTVFLGLDHGHGGKTPVVFETMIFPSEDNLSERDCWRYCTYQEAIEGHKHACEVARSYGSGIPKEDLEKAAKVIQDLISK